MFLRQTMAAACLTPFAAHVWFDRLAKASQKPKKKSLEEEVEELKARLRSFGEEV